MTRRNNTPRKSLNYQTPLEVFMKYITDDQFLKLTFQAEKCEESLKKHLKNNEPVL